MTPRHDPAKIARNNRRLNMVTVAVIVVVALAYFFATNAPAAPVRPAKHVRTV
ncbi:hypothetical protein [Cupriavidus sp. USMAA2-4]|uniref:hypothetical protein n=1 Tax=Cupriavidus sp. USMAA2-4 TaxID=876364 RepID=UPI0012F4C1FA|nr:hypothetical protein [Cupriavidus sp. USMAA2-4]